MHRYFIVYETIAFDNHKESQIIDVDFAVVDNNTLNSLLYEVNEQISTIPFCKSTHLPAHCILDFKELPIKEKKND